MSMIRALIIDDEQNCIDSLVFDLQKNCPEVEVVETCTSSKQGLLSIKNLNPDLVFLADSKCCQQSADTVKARTGWSGITAVKNSQIVALDDDVASRWGPRVVDLVRAIVDAVSKIPA